MSNGHMELVKQLLGADDPSGVWEILRIQNQLGKTILHFSASCEQLQQFKDFLESILSSEQLSELCSTIDRSGKTADEVTTKSEEASQLISNEEADVEEQGEGILHPPVQQTASNYLASSEEENSKVTCTDSIGRLSYNITEDLPTNTETVEASLAKSLGLKALKDLKWLPPKESSAMSDVNISTAGPQRLIEILWEQPEPLEPQEMSTDEKESLSIVSLESLSLDPELLKTQPSTPKPLSLDSRPPKTPDAASVLQGGELGYSTKLLEDKVRELRHRVEGLEKQQLLQQLQERGEQKERQFPVTQDLQERIHQQEMELCVQKVEQLRVRQECDQLQKQNIQLAMDLSEQKEELMEQTRQLKMVLRKQKDEQLQVRQQCYQLREQNSQLAMGMEEIMKHLGLLSIPSKDLATPKSTTDSGVVAATSLLTAALQEEADG